MVKVTPCLAGEPTVYDDYILLVREISIISQISRKTFNGSNRSLKDKIAILTGRKIVTSGARSMTRAFLSSVGQPYKKRQPR